MSRCAGACTAPASCAATGPSRSTARAILCSEVAALEGVAAVDAAALAAALQPADALRARAVRERLGNDGALRAPLQRVVADLRGGVQRRLDVAGLEPPGVLLLHARRPHAGEAAALRLDPHGERVGLRAIAAAAHRVDLLHDAEQVLDVVA